MKFLKTLRLPLHDLVMNFHDLMVAEGAKHFTIPGYNCPFWYITDVRQDGTYPCHPQENGNPCYPYFVDYKTMVTIHFKTTE